MPDVHALPKAELHIHVEGSLEPELVFSLARRNGVQLPWASVEQLQAEKEFTDLQSFLDLYYSCMSVLRTVRDFRDLAHDYFRRAYAQGVHHAELFFDPQAHTTRGVLVDDVIDGLLEGIADAEEELGVSGGLILCILRDRPVEEALDTLESVRHRADELIGIGLDSAELGHPPRCSPRSTSGPRRWDCTSSRTPERKARRTTSARLWTSCTSSGSTTACAAWTIRSS